MHGELGNNGFCACLPQDLSQRNAAAIRVVGVGKPEIVPLEKIVVAINLQLVFGRIFGRDKLPAVLLP
jgi:hypothetical protein